MTSDFNELYLSFVLLMLGSCKTHGVKQIKHLVDELFTIQVVLFPAFLLVNQVLTVWLLDGNNNYMFDNLISFTRIVHVLTYEHCYYCSSGMIDNTKLKLEE